MKKLYKFISYFISFVVLAIILVYAGNYIYGQYQNKMIDEKIDKVAGVKNSAKIEGQGHEYEFEDFQKEVVGFIPNENGAVLRGILLSKFDDRLNQPNVRIDLYDSIVVSMVYPNLLKDCQVTDDEAVKNGYGCWNNLKKGEFYEFRCADSECKNIVSISLYEEE